MTTTPVRIYKDIDLTFSRLNPADATGDIAKRVDVNAVKQSIKTLLLTQKGERLFQPQIGSDLYALLFEPMDFITIEALKAVILNCLANYEPRIVVDSLVMDPNYDENSYVITLNFYTIGVYAPATFNFTLKRLR